MLYILAVIERKTEWAALISALQPSIRPWLVHRE